MTARNQTAGARKTGGDWVWAHVGFGWWSLLAFLTLGLGLEALHGLGAAWYLDVANGTRRQMWTLAHAHGTLLSLISIFYGVAAASVSGPEAIAGLATGARYLRAANLFLPLGFFTGGVYFHDGDPGLGIILVPIGAGALLLGVLFAARTASTKPVPKARKRGGKKRSSKH